MLLLLVNMFSVLVFFFFFCNTIDSLKMIRIFQSAFNKTEVLDFNTVNSRKQKAGPKLLSKS